MEKSHHILGGVLGRLRAVDGGQWNPPGVSGAAPKASFRALKQSDPYSARRWPCRRTGAADNVKAPPLPPGPQEPKVSKTLTPGMLLGGLWGLRALKMEPLGTL